MEKKKKLIEFSRQKWKDLVVLVVRRTSDGYYDYRLDQIYYKPAEEERSDDVDVYTVYCGFYQEWSCDEIEHFLFRLGFTRIY